MHLMTNWGTWIFDGDKTKTVTPLKAIKELVGGQSAGDIRAGSDL